MSFKIYTANDRLLTDINILNTEVAQIEQDLIRPEFTSLTLGQRDFFVTNVSQFPTPVGNVITIVPGSTYRIVGDVDLEGNRLVCPGPTAILGNAPETSTLRSTGLPAGEIMISAQGNFECREITVGCPVDTTLLEVIDGLESILDLIHVNFGSDVEAVGTIGLLDGYADMNIFDCAFHNIDDGLTITGTVNRVTINRCTFNTTIGGGNAYLTLADQLIVNKRFTIANSDFVIPAGAFGIVNIPGSTIPDEGLFFNGLSFSGAGTYITPINPGDAFARFENCIGVNNSLTRGSLSMIGNAVVTDINLQNTPVKIAGITNDSEFNERFIMPLDNRLTFTGIRSGIFQFTANAALLGNNGLVFQIAAFVNGMTEVTESIGVATTDGTTRATPVTSQALISLDPNEFVELFIENTTSDVDVTVQNLNIQIVRLV